MNSLYLTLFLIFNLVAQEHHDELKIKPSLFKEIGITFTSLKNKALEQHIKSYGEVIPTNNGFSKVGTLVSGRIAKIHVILGQRVKKGDPLFEVSSLEVMELMDNYFSSEAELKRAKKTYTRLKKLRKEGIGSEKSFFKAESAYEKSNAEFESSDRKIHAIGFTDQELKTLSKSTKHHSANMIVRAPISGILTELSARRGQFVSGKETLAKLLDRNKLWVRLHVYEKDISYVKLSSKVEISSANSPSVRYTGKIISKSQSFMKGKKSIEVIASVSHPKGLILGSNITAIIFSPVGKEIPVIEAEAVIQENGENFVFVRISEDEFEKRKVIIGKQIASYIHILNGLQKNESLVKHGSFYLKSLSKGEEIGGHDD